MSIIKLSSGKSSAAMIEYCSMGKIHKGTEPSGERYTSWTNSLGLEKPEQVESAWSLTREGFGKNNGIQYHHASLSLDPFDEKTKTISDTKLLKMAETFVKKHAPDHDYAIFIHRDKEHPHAHILWNSVNHETGKKFHSSRDDLKKAIEIKDSLDLKYGLKVTEKSKKADIIPDKVKRLHQRDPDAYIWTEDLKSRIEAAFSGSTSFEDYRTRLAQDGVTATPRGKDGAITYSFSDANGTERKCRETRLGGDYARERIEQLLERGREQPQGNPEQYQSSEKSTGDRERDKKDKGRDNFSPQLDTGISPNNGSEPRGPQDSRARLDQQIYAALERDRGFEGTGFSFADLFDRHFPKDGRITLSTNGTSRGPDYGHSGSSESLRKEHDFGVIRIPESAENGIHVFRNSDRHADNNRHDSHFEQVKSAVKELQNASSLRQYLEVKRDRDNGIPADESGRVNRNDKTHKSELVRHYCRVDYESHAAARGCEREFKAATERTGKDFKSRTVETFRTFAERIKEIRTTGKEFLEQASTTIRGIREKTRAAISWYNSHGEKIFEHYQSVEKLSRDTKSLGGTVAEAQRDLEAKAKKLTVSRSRSGPGLGM